MFFFSAQIQFNGFIPPTVSFSESALYQKSWKVCLNLEKKQNLWHVDKIYIKSMSKKTLPFYQKSATLSLFHQVSWDATTLTSCAWRIYPSRVHYRHTLVWDSCRQEEEGINFKSWHTLALSHLDTRKHTHSHTQHLSQGTSAFIANLRSCQWPPGWWLTRLHISYFILLSLAALFGPPAN